MITMNAPPRLRLQGCTESVRLLGRVGNVGSPSVFHLPLSTVQPNGVSPGPGCHAGASRHLLSWLTMARKRAWMLRASAGPARIIKALPGWLMTALGSACAAVRAKAHRLRARFLRLHGLRAPRRNSRHWRLDAQPRLVHLQDGVNYRDLGADHFFHREYMLQIQLLL